MKIYGGGGGLPCNRLMELCRLIGSHSHDWIDYNGVAISLGNQKIEVGRDLKMGRFLLH